MFNTHVRHVIGGSRVVIGEPRVVCLYMWIVIGGSRAAHVWIVIGGARTVRVQAVCDWWI